MDTLMDSAAGIYAVVTNSSSVYVIDLDSMMFSRLRGLEDPTAVSLRRDEEAADLLRIVECTVGRRMVLMVNLHVEGVLLTRRETTAVRTIRSLPEWIREGGSDGADG